RSRAFWLGSPIWFTRNPCSKAASGTSTNPNPAVTLSNSVADIDSGAADFVGCFASSAKAAPESAMAATAAAANMYLVIVISPFRHSEVNQQLPSGLVVQRPTPAPFSIPCLRPLLLAVVMPNSEADDLPPEASILVLTPCPVRSGGPAALTLSISLSLIALGFAASPA